MGLKCTHFCKFKKCCLEVVVSTQMAFTDDNDRKGVRVDTIELSTKLTPVDIIVTTVEGV